MSTMLEIRNAVANYGAVNALNDVSITVNKGEIVSLIGANGAGKSTLIMSIFGQPKLISGQIIFNQQDLGSVKTSDIAKLGIAISPEGRRIFPAMTTEENLVMGSIFSDTSNEQLDYVYDLFPRLGERKKQRAGTMSGGEQQMLAIGRALMSKPSLLLLDEPSLGLAPIIVSQIFSVLAEIAKNGTTIFIVEQNAHHALKLSDRGYVLANGKIVTAGSSDSLLSNDDVKRAYLGAH